MFSSEDCQHTSVFISSFMRTALFFSPRIDQWITDSHDGIDLSSLPPSDPDVSLGALDRDTASQRDAELDLHDMCAKVYFVYIYMY